jgi:hypothetical protein
MPTWYGGSPHEPSSFWWSQLVPLIHVAPRALDAAPFLLVNADERDVGLGLVVDLLELRRLDLLEIGLDRLLLDLKRLIDRLDIGRLLHGDGPAGCAELNVGGARRAPQLGQGDRGEQHEHDDVQGD